MVHLASLYLTVLYVFYMAARKSVIAPLQLLILIGLLFFSDPILQTKNVTNYIDFILITIFLAPITIIFIYECLDKRKFVNEQVKLTSVKWGLVANSLFFLELFKRLSHSDYNLQLFIDNHLLPRGLAPWDLVQFSGAAHYALLKALLPFAALVVFLELMKRHNISKLYYFCVYAVLLIFIASSGSRTPLFFVVLTSTLLYVSEKTYVTKVLISILSAAMLFMLGSIIVLTRGDGYFEMTLYKLKNNSLQFHVDNNYSLAKYAIGMTGQGHEPWAFDKFLGSIIFNPIPRAIWAEKPAFYEDDYGVFKEQWWTTMSFIGELAALAPNFFIFLSMFFLFFVYCIARIAYRFNNSEVGFILYMCVCIYLYLCTRSLFSIGTFIYLPATVLLLTRVTRLNDKN